MMDERFEQELREKVRDEISKTKQSIAEYKELTKPVELDSAIGRVSRMDAINNKSVTEAALRQAEMKLKKLIHVESQIGKAGFGECVIPIKH